MAMGTRPSTPSTTRTRSGSRSRGGMQSTTRTRPSGVVNVVSSTGESPRYRRDAAVVPPAGPSRQYPWSAVPRRAAKQATESKRGRHSQSIDPFRPTRAAGWVTPMTA